MSGRWRVRVIRSSVQVMYVVYTPEGERVLGYYFPTVADAADFARRGWAVRHRIHLGHDLPPYALS